MGYSSLLCELHFSFAAGHPHPSSTSSCQGHHPRHLQLLLCPQLQRTPYLPRHPLPRHPLPPPLPPPLTVSLLFPIFLLLSIPISRPSLPFSVSPVASFKSLAVILELVCMAALGTMGPVMLCSKLKRKQEVENSSDEAAGVHSGGGAGGG